MSATYKNTEANTKVYDLNQKTMQALIVWRVCTLRSRIRGPMWKM